MTNANNIIDFIDLTVDADQQADDLIDVANRLIHLSSCHIDLANRLTNTARRQVFSNLQTRRAIGTVDLTAEAIKSPLEHVSNRLNNVSLRQAAVPLRLAAQSTSRIALNNQSANVEKPARGLNQPAVGANHSTSAEVINHLAPAEVVNRPTPAEMVNHPTPAEVVNHPTPAEVVNRPAPEEVINHLAPAEVVNQPIGGELMPVERVNHPVEASQLVVYPQPANVVAVQECLTPDAVSEDDSYNDDDNDIFEDRAGDDDGDDELPEIPKTPPDLVIKGKDNQIEVHKELFVQLSPVFKNMFMYNEYFGEYNQQEVKITEGPHFLDIIKKAMYNRRIKINSRNVIIAMMASSKYFLPTPRIFVTLYIRNSLSIGNCLRYLHYTQLFQYQQLHREVFSYCCSHFYELRRVLRRWVNSTELTEFLRSDFLNVADEEELLDILHSCDFEDHELIELMQFIRFELLTIRTLQQLLRSSRFSGFSFRIAEAIDNKNHLPAVCWANNQDKRRCRRRRPVFLAIGGNNGDDGEVHHSMECFVEGDTIWRSSIPQRVRPGKNPRISLVLPTVLNQATNAAVTYTDDTVYVIGGKERVAYGRAVIKYTVKDNTWRALSALLPWVCQGHAAAMCESFIYVTGGINAKTVFFMNPDKEKPWKSNKDLPQVRSFHCSVGAFGLLYVLGGFVQNDHSCPTRSMARFEPLTQSWEAMPDMAFPRAHMAAAVLGHAIFVFGGDDGLNEYRSCEKYDIITRKWTSICDMSQTRSRFSAVPCGNRIFCYGGQSNENALTSCDMYNPRTDQWHSLTSMKVPRRDLGAAVLFLPEEEPEEA